MGEASLSNISVSKKTKDGTNSEMSKATMSSLCFQHPASDSKRDYVPQQEAPNRCSLIKDGGRKRHKRYHKPQAKLGQPKPSVGSGRKTKTPHNLAFSANAFWQNHVLSPSMAAKLRPFEEPRPPEGKGKD